MDKKRQSILKQEGRIPLQETILPDFPDDDNTATVTVTKSRRVSFGANVIKEFIVGSAVSTQFLSEYEQAVSSDSSRSGLLDQSSLQNEGDVLNLCVNKNSIDNHLMPPRKKVCSDKPQIFQNENHDRNNDKNWEFNISNTSTIFTSNINKSGGVPNKADFRGSSAKCIKKTAPLNDSYVLSEKQILNKQNESELNYSRAVDNSEKKSKQGKFSSTICFSADSPTADMEFTEGCISLAKSIFDKKKKEMTVYIQGKPKETKREEKKESNDTILFESSDVEMSLTKCVQDESEADVSEEADMSLTKCAPDNSEMDESDNMSKCFKVSSSVNFVDSFNDPDEDIQNVPPHKYPLNVILGQGDDSEDDAELERSLFFPERSLTEMLNSDPLKTSVCEGESLNKDDNQECDMEISMCDPLKISMCKDASPYGDENEVWKSTIVPENRRKSALSNGSLLLAGDAKESGGELITAEPLKISMSDVSMLNDNSQNSILGMLSADILKNPNYNQSILDDDNTEVCEMEMTDVGNPYLLKASLMRLSQSEREDEKENVVPVEEESKRDETEANEEDDAMNLTEPVNRHTDVVSPENVDDSGNVERQVGEAEPADLEKDDESDGCGAVVTEVEETESNVVKEILMQAGDPVARLSEVKENGVVEESECETGEITENKENMEGVKPCGESSTGDDAGKGLTTSEETEVKKSPALEKEEGNKTYTLEQANHSLEDKEEKNGETEEKDVSVNSGDIEGRQDSSVEPKLDDRSFPNQKESDKTYTMERSHAEIVNTLDEKEEIPTDENNEMSMNLELVEVNDNFPSESNSNDLCITEQKESERTFTQQKPACELRGSPERVEKMDVTEGNGASGEIAETVASKAEEEEMSRCSLWSEREKTHVIEKVECNWTYDVVPMEEKIENPVVREEEMCGAREEEKLEETPMDVEQSPGNLVEDMEVEGLGNERLSPRQEQLEESLGQVGPAEEEEDCQEEHEPDEEAPLELSTDQTNVSLDVTARTFRTSTQWEESRLDQSGHSDWPSTLFGDKKISLLLKEQSEEPNCHWKIESLDCGEGSNDWSFSFALLESSAMVKFKLKPPKDKSLVSFSTVLDRSISLVTKPVYQSEKEKVAINFTFEKLRSYFSRESFDVDNVHNIPLFLDRMNLFWNKMNGVLGQILKILREYPGSRLKGSVLSFRLYSFPLMFSCSVMVEMSDPLHMTENSVTVTRQFGNFSASKIKSAFKVCLLKEDALVQFIRTLTQSVIDREYETGALTIRSHIRLIA